MFLNKNSVGKKTLSIMLTAAMVASLAVTTAVTSNAATIAETESNAATNTVGSSANRYGLADNIQDGVILHCFDWKYSDIEAELPNIAAAGFTSVQTSPAQANNNSGTWYWLYQPRGFYVDRNDLGTKAELQSLCAKAEEYGIKVVVDVVANHLEGVHNNIVDDLKPDQYWHHTNYTSDYPPPPGKQSIDWGNRYQVTNGEIGMMDLATENSYVQQSVKKYIQELKGLGVDGCRFDAAKHIGVPSEGDNFWREITSDKSLWYYGEILDSPGGDGPSIMKEYTQYISVTDSGYGDSIRGDFAGGGVPGSIGNWSQRGVATNKLVYWAESHDTYSNGGNGSFKIDQNRIDRAYAVAAARVDATSLYFSRPFQTDKESIRAGQKGSTHFTSKEVAEVNKFHNAMVGKADYYSNSNGCATITRKGGGAVIVKGNGSGSVSVPNGGGYVPADDYIDQISGNKFTVTSSTISGTVGSSGIAVIYKATPTSSVSATPGTENGTYKYKSDTVSVTLNASNVTDAKYSIDGGSATSFTDGQKVTLGSGVAYETTQTLTLTAKDNSGSTVSATYKFLKSNQGTTIYFDNSSYNWSSVYAYVYKGEGESAEKIAAWPGVKITNTSSKTGYYYYDVPDNFSDGMVIFSDGTGSDTNRYPADMQPGLQLGGASHLFSSGNNWKEYSETVTPTEPPTIGTSYMKGDANGDGAVNMKDAVLVQKAVLSASALTSTGKLAADIDGNGSISVADVVEIMRYIVGYSNTYGIGLYVNN